MAGPQSLWGRQAETFSSGKTSSRLSPTQSLTLQPTHTFENCPTDVDILCVPGGFGAWDVTGNLAAMEFLQRIGKKARYVTGICFGTVIMAAAGLLDGYKAATQLGFLSDARSARRRGGPRAGRHRPEPDYRRWRHRWRRFRSYGSRRSSRRNRRKGHSAADRSNPQRPLDTVRQSAPGRTRAIAEQVWSRTISRRSAMPAIQAVVKRRKAESRHLKHFEPRLFLVRICARVRLSAPCSRAPA